MPTRYSRFDSKIKTYNSLAKLAVKSVMPRQPNLTNMSQTNPCDYRLFAEI